MMVRSQFVSRGFCSGERSLPCKGSPSAFRRSQIAAAEPSAGFTLLELIAAMTILLLLTAVAMPMARMQVQRTREEELRRDLRDLRQTIDRYKDFSDRGMIPMKFESYGYPPDLDTLVNGVELKGPSNKKYKFLRRIPVDPMTGKAEWGMRSMQDDPDSKSWGGENVFDVYTLGTGKALDGTDYSDW